MDSLDRAMFGNETVDELFSDQGFLKAVLRVEAALAVAEASVGIIPASAAERIVAACESDSIDAKDIYYQGAAVGTPMIPLIHALEEAIGSEAAGYLHYGATTQDIIDTALMYQMRAAAHSVRDEVTGIMSRCAELTQTYRDTLMIGRTLGQHAVPMTFGLKTARWLDSLMRDLERLDRLDAGGFTVQLGGAVGTLAPLGTAGLEVSNHVAKQLQLNSAPLAWHTERDRITDIVSTLAALVGNLSKIATDIFLLSQTEVGEVSEGGGSTRGSGSSTMPHKRNPGNSVRARGAGQLALTHVSGLLTSVQYEHERAAGGWQAEWTHLPNVFRYGAGCASLVRAAVNSLEIDESRMEENVFLTRGVIMAEALSLRLAPTVGRSSAAALVSKLCDNVNREQITLLEAASRSEELAAIISPSDLSQLLNPASYLGVANAIIDGVLQRYTDASER